MHYRKSSLPGLYSVAAARTPYPNNANQNCLQTLPNVLWKLLVENHWARGPFEMKCRAFYLLSVSISLSLVVKQKD